MTKAFSIFKAAQRDVDMTDSTVVDAVAAGPVFEVQVYALWVPGHVNRSSACVKRPASASSNARVPVARYDPRATGVFNLSSFLGELRMNPGESTR
ncbi:MAG: hypothetical protein CGW95_01005 [Phenylobacterium zucineum]|nr:MAG: hypothetical protein CGW95_01005 [Phenylobacterium zucineum]